MNEWGGGGHYDVAGYARILTIAKRVLLVAFDALYIWWLGELAAPSAVVSDVFRPFRAIYVLHLDLPPRPANDTGFLDAFKGFIHGRARIELPFIRSPIL
tara:strand:- start:2638 stop:2937 length:300 start_codon:yes stop_codon:yes gene_type:complete